MRKDIYTNPLGGVRLQDAGLKEGELFYFIQAGGNSYSIGKGRHFINDIYGQHIWVFKNYFLALKTVYLYNQGTRYQGPKTERKYHD